MKALSHHPAVPQPFADTVKVLHAGLVDKEKSSATTNIHVRTVSREIMQLFAAIIQSKMPQRALLVLLLA